jgi:DNA-binding transcriptional regulator YiaG
MLTGEDVKNTRAALGLSQQELAELVGISQARTIRKWERDEVCVPAPVAIMLIALLTSRAVRRYFGVSLPDDQSATQV